MGRTHSKKIPGAVPHSSSLKMSPITPTPMESPLDAPKAWTTRQARRWEVLRDATTRESTASNAMDARHTGFHSPK